MLSEEELKERIVFSNIFESRKIENIPKRFIYISGKAISKMFIMVIILILASTVTVYAVIKALIIKVNIKNSDISIEEEYKIKSKIAEIYYLYYLPYNFREAERDVADNSVTIHYKNNDSDLFVRQELPIGEGHIDNEETKEEKVLINEIEGIYVEKHEEKVLIFYSHGYLFYIDTNSKNVTKDDLVKMAESLKMEEKQ